MPYRFQLYYAAKWSDIETIRRLIAAGEPINDGTYDSALAVAVRSPHADVAALSGLLELGADLRCSLSPNDLSKTRFLLDKGVTPYRLLSPNLDFVSFQEVLQAWIKTVGSKPWLGFTIFDQVLIHHGVKGVRLLLDHGADPTESEWNDLHLAVVVGTADEVRQALAKGEKPQHPFPEDCDWTTTPDPWSLALWVGDLEKLEILEGAGADPLHLDGKDQTGLFIAAQANQPEVVHWLAQRGVPIDWPFDNFEKTAFEIACKSGSVYATEALIELGALKEHFRSENRPSLYWSVGNMEVLHLLIDNELPFHDSAIDALLVTAVERSDDEFARDLIKMTRERGAPGRYGVAMSAAVRNDERNIVRMMLDAYWNPNALDDDVSPMYAVRSPEIDQMLTRAGGRVIWDR